ncbi:MAG: TetR family transcriptional regulator [bacterium]|nr:TetR family transcriptional regulator [bacterium]
MHHRDGAARVRGERTRAAILEAAERLFADRGYSNTRLADVAEQVGIRRASIVYYFRDKRELYEAMLDEAFGPLLAKHRQTLEAEVPFTEKLERLAVELSTYGWERPTAFRLVLHEIAAGPQLASPVIAGLFAPVGMALHEAAMREEVVTGKSLSAVRPHEILMTVVGTVMYRLFAPQVVAPGHTGPVSIDAMRDDLITIIRALTGSSRRPRLIRKV